MNALASPLTALKAVADPSRLRLLRLLDRDEFSVGELAAITDLAQSSVSRHLAVLRRAGLVVERAEGVRSYLSLATAPPGDVAPLVSAVMELVREADLEHPEDLSRLELVRAEREGDREAVFDALADDWDALRDRLLGGSLAPPEIAALLVPGGLRIVDAGAGTGVLLPWLAALAGPDGEVVAVERSARMAKRAAARAQEFDNVRVERGRIEDLPVEDDWADRVVLCLALGHTKDPVAALRRCLRALRPGGQVVVCDVERHGDETLVRRLGNGFAGFDPDELREAFVRAGFVNVRRVEWPAPATRTNGRDDASPTGRAAIHTLTALHVVGERPLERRASRRKQ